MLLNLRCILLCFQAVSGLNINLTKTELVIFGEGNNKELTDILGCKLANLPFKYLSSLVGLKHKDGSIWDPIIKNI